MTEEHLALDRPFFAGAAGFPLQLPVRVDA